VSECVLTIRTLYIYIYIYIYVCILWLGVDGACECVSACVCVCRKTSSGKALTRRGKLHTHASPPN